MARFLLHVFGKLQRSRRTLFLALIWVCGLLLGCQIFLFTDPSTLSLMRQAAERPVSIVGSANVILIPFLFSALAVYLCRRWVLCVLIFTKAFSFAFVSLCAIAAYGSGSWIACPLLMFSDAGAAIFLWAYWLRFGSGERSFSWAGFFPYLGACVLVGSVDIWVISPFLAML